MDRTKPLEGKMSLKIGIQMYSVREAFAKNPIEAIRKVSEIGYRYIELANLHAEKDCGCGFGVSARELKKVADDFGSEIFSAHLEPLDASNIDQVLDYYTELGVKYIVSKQCDSTIAEVTAACENYNFLGEKCRKAGIQHLLHLGQSGYCEDGEWSVDKVARLTAPENLKFEVDTYWMLRSGFNPCNIIRKFCNRCAIVHQKDLPRDFCGTVNINSLLGLGEQVVHSNLREYVQPEDFCEIGSGQMNVREIIDITEKYTKASHIVLEQDNSQLGEFESIRKSYQYLTSVLSEE